MLGEGGPAWCHNNALTLAGRARVLAWPSRRFVWSFFTQHGHSAARSDGGRVCSYAIQESSKRV